MSRTATARAVALLGVDGHLVDVEADVSAGLPGTTLVGVPDTALSEARDRVRAAVRNSGFTWPPTRVTVSLTPAALPKGGSGYDLACAAAVLRAHGEPLSDDLLAGSVLAGELGLDGRVRAVPGVLAVAVACRRAGVPRLVTSTVDAAEARLVEGLRVTGVATLRELVDHLCGRPVPEVEPASGSAAPAGDLPDLRDVAGQREARRALEVAAAGGHHLLLTGPPGAGKTMLAERLPGILPPLTPEEALEVGAVRSVAGRAAGGLLPVAPPFETAHHTATPAALVGGGSRVVRPGLVSLAHRGVLFLDEAPELRRDSLEALRQPLGDGHVTLVRSGVQQRFPCRFQLVMAANPCPCALAGADQECRCSAGERRRYQARLSGPLLDRVDLRVEVRPLVVADVTGEVGGESSATVAARVAAARARARTRLAGSGWERMADVPSGVLRQRWPLPVEAMRPALRELDRGRLTGRGLDRVMRVAWTLADLGERECPAQAEVTDALGLRGVVPSPRRAGAGAGAW